MITVDSIEYKPQHTPEDYETLKTLAKASLGFVPDPMFPASYVILDSSGAKEVNLRHGCHRSISESRLRDRTLVWTAISTLHPKELIAPWIKWFVQESWASKFILNKDDLDEVMSLGIFVSADMPAPLLQNIMIMSRHSLEVAERAFSKFNELIDKGILPSVAYSLTMNSAWSSRNKFTEDENLRQPVYPHGGHRVQGLLTLEGFVKQQKGILFDKIDNEFPTTMHTTYRQSNGYYGGSRIFGWKPEYPEPTTTLWLANQQLAEKIGEFRKQLTTSEMYRPPNPFSRSSKVELRANDISYLEMFEVVAPFINNYVLEQVAQEEERKAA